MSQIVVSFVGELCFGDAKYGVSVHKLSKCCNNINKFIGCCVKYVGKDMIFLYHSVYIYNLFALHWAL